jgi:elongation factor P
MRFDMASMEAGQVRKGMVLVGEGGQLQLVVGREFIAPGNWRSILHLKLKNLKTGSVTTLRPKSQDKVEVAYLDKRPMQYLYQEGTGYVFMDKETFDQVTLDRDSVAEQMLFLQENDDAQVILYEEKPIGLELPPHVFLKVAYTEPAKKGAAAVAQYKPAKMETGLEVQVPPFIEIGESIQIDTESGEYVGRAKG